MVNILKKYQALLLVILCYITVFAFYPSIKSGFTCVDDSAMVTVNPYITDLSIENIKKAFTSYYFKLYHPIVTLSYMLEYHFFQKDPYIYHLDNLILHVFNALIVFFILKKITKSIAIAYITALLFAIHPTRVETVFWISSRKDTLCSFFYLLSIFLYIKNYDSKYFKTFLALSLFSFILSCMSKPMAVTLPVILILIDYFYNKFNIKQCFKYIPFILISLIFCIITIYGYYDSNQKEMASSYRGVINILDAHYNILFYLKEIFYPTSSFLHPVFYNHFQLPPNKVLYSPALVWLILFSAVYSLKFTKKISFGFIFFIIVLLPSSGIMTTGMSPVTDRYIYLAYIGLFYLFAEFIFFIYKKLHVRQAFIVLFLISLTIALFYLTFNRSILWTDNNKLIINTIKKYPDIASHAYLVLGSNYKEDKEYDKALECYKKSYAIDKTTTYIYFNLGHIYQLLGDNEKALKYYNIVRNIASTDYIAMINNVAIMKKENNSIDEAINIIEKGLKVREIFEDYIFYSLAVFYFEKKDYDKSIENIKEALKRNPLEKKYYSFLFDIYKKQKKYEEIEKLLINFRKYNIKDYNFLNSVGIMYFEQANYKDAKNIFYSSLDYNQKNNTAYFFLGNIYAIQEEYKSAVVCYTLAILYGSKDARGEYCFKRAVAWFYLNKYYLALKDMNKAIEYNFDVPKEFKEDLNKKLKEI